MRGVYEVLADVGFAGLTTERVADAAGCSQSLVHYHFNTKEDLVVAFLDRIHDGESEWLSTLNASNPEDRLLEFIDAQLSVPRDDEHGRFNMAFLELHAAAARNERYAAALRRFSALLQDTLVEIIQDGIETGAFREIDPKATARFLRHALQGAVAEAVTLDLEQAKAEAATGVKAYLERVVLANSG